MIEYPRQVSDLVGLDLGGSAAQSVILMVIVIAAIACATAPKAGDPNAPLKAMLVDSKYDQYLGVICIVRIIDGTLKKGDRVA